MKAFTSLAAFAALCSAATVTLKETACLQRTGTLEEFTIEVDQLVVKDLPTVCGLHIVSAAGVDVNSLSCRAYIDAAGTQPGSAIFNSTNDALIATNPVQEGSIRCNSTQNGLPNNATTSLIGRSTFSTATASGVTNLPISTGNVTVSGTRTPTTSPTGTAAGASGAPSPTGAAAHVHMSVVAVLGAFAVYLL